MNVPVIFRKTGMVIAKNSPAILTGFSVAGLIGTVAFAIKATPKATLIVDELHEKYTDEKIPKLELVKAVTPVYIPTIIMGGVTIACIIGASTISSRRNAVLASLYSASEMALKEYQSKVVEKIGEKKEQEVRDEIVKEKIAKNPVENTQIIMTGKGETLCYDLLSGRYFKSDIEKIRRIENQVNKNIICYMFVTLNEVYEKLGLDEIELGQEIGWNNDNNLEFKFSSQLTPDGQPCLAIGYSVEPKHYANY